MSRKYDIIILGTLKEKRNYLGSKTYYLYEILKKYLPEYKIAVYDCLEDDNKRIELDANNFIFTPWVETLDEDWCSCFISLDGIGKKILYTDNFYWYEEQKKRLLQEGFNLENLFSSICFSTRENSEWWSKKGYHYWGVGIFNEYFNNIPKKDDNLQIFVDSPWSFDLCSEPYNALRVLNECMPILKNKYPNLKIISQDCDLPWVDENIKGRIDLDEIIKIYANCNAYIVSHNENCGYAQFENKFCGTKIVTNKNFSNHSVLLTDNCSYELWSFEDGNKSFIKAIENCLNPYDRTKIINNAIEIYNDESFFNQIKKDLWGL